MNKLKRITEIMERHDAKCSLEDFLGAVSITFHKYESEVYDEVHNDMWNSLPQQFALLAEACLQGVQDLRAEIQVLDIGCGTGLASDCLLRTQLGKRIRGIDLLDTSSSMLSRAAVRAESWNVPFACLKGEVERFTGRKHYDLIVACSVLHHVPNLKSFLNAVRTLQADNGLFMHVQDPNGDFQTDQELKHRAEEASRHFLPEWARRLSPPRILGRIYRELTGKQGQNYVSMTVRELVQTGIIQTPLTVDELFAIVDIHVHDERGISVSELGSMLPDYELITRRSYGFFGRLWSTLPPSLRATEERLIAQNALNGAHVSAVWKLRQ